MRAKRIDAKTKTSLYMIENVKHETVLGLTKFDPGWRQFCFFPNLGTRFSKSCTDEIGKFLEKLNSERKTNTSKSKAI